jgi:hypothetical protein
MADRPELTLPQRKIATTPRLPVLFQLWPSKLRGFDPRAFCTPSE